MYWNTQTTSCVLQSLARIRAQSPHQRCVNNNRLGYACLANDEVLLLRFAVVASERWRSCVFGSRLEPAARRGRLGGREIIFDGRDVATHEGENGKPRSKCHRDRLLTQLDRLHHCDLGFRTPARNTPRLEKKPHPPQPYPGGCAKSGDDLRASRRVRVRAHVVLARGNVMLINLAPRIICCSNQKKMMDVAALPRGSNHWNHRIRGRVLFP